ncbi:CotO family spore coat protein [Radiobacillus deserti]|uniref:Spore coat protein CotO n=1 Tax=Radiobacillus deserti TaxID=2594883 RepID=A0A516KEQ8_9BACI|nr:CotO family spore coat protein [Radiobacillus deserti]QDP39806.1 hypothetical protein FN924_06255 [Radiobacillus deserti]
MNKRFSRKPMLYIQQPELGKPSAKMQVNYRTTKKRKASAEKSVPEKPVKDEKAKTKKRIKQLTDIPVEEDTSVDEIADSSSSSSDEADENTNSSRRRRFKELSMEERIEYFMNVPSNVPRMKCQVITEETKYRGIITDYKDNIVYMRVTKRPFRVQLNLDEILDVQLIGF